MGIEEPKEYTPEEIAELEKSRTISDAELLKGGAEYVINEEGEKENLLVTDKKKDRLSDERSLSTLDVLGKTIEGINDVWDVQDKIRNASPELIRRIVHNAEKELYVTYSEASYPDFRLWNEIPSIEESGHPDWDPSIGLAQTPKGLSSITLKHLIGLLNAEEVRTQGSTVLYVIHG